MIAFKGRPCYQFEVTLDPVDRTSVFRAFIAHGMGYQLQLTGGAEPVEERPDAAAIFDGFAFTEAPAPPDDPRRQRDAATHERSLELTGFGGMLLVVALALFVLTRWLRRTRHA